MNHTFILKRKGAYYRVARCSIDLPGHAIMRDWVVLRVEPEWGSPSDTHEPTFIGGAALPRKTVEQRLIDSGEYAIHKMIQL